MKRDMKTDDKKRHWSNLY